MRICELSIKNYKAISAFEITELKDTVVIAGPNGCGKTCIFDAIRLLKSAYGGYRENEWQQLFGEFQINLGDKEFSWSSLFHDTSKPIEISANIQLAPAEREYLIANAEQLVQSHLWGEYATPAPVRGVKSPSLARELRIRAPDVEQRAREDLPEFLKELENGCHTAELMLLSDGRQGTAPSLVLEVLFGTYDPEHLGVVHYHSASRQYARERLNEFNFRTRNQDRLGQFAILSADNKYSNLKSEMAASYLRQLVLNAAGTARDSKQELSETLQELFATFFPGKSFLGATATENGGVHFPVRTQSGRTHDIDELSSGEKEVLYGYLRLRNDSIKNSVLLIDEPELHLNPRLVNGLVSFYHRHLGNPLGTQLWLITHSDAIIREAVGQAGFSVFHMRSSEIVEVDNQASSLDVAADLERLVVDLVGDLAAYRPGARIVVFEGESAAEVDVRMTQSLFPAFSEAVNAISGGGKRRVGQLYELLEQARASGSLPGKFFAITDGDDEVYAAQVYPRKFQWDVYHIENYLLDAKYVGLVLDDLNSRNRLGSDPHIYEALRTAAGQLVTKIISHRMRKTLNVRLVSSLDLGVDPNRTDVPNALAEAVQNSCRRVSELASDATAGLSDDFDRLRAELESQLVSGEWTRTFPGRDVLKRFVREHVPGIRYESFRDLIIAKMRLHAHQPLGMKAVIDCILAA
ncbi:MAG: AAA family ATPase [Pirellulales bacterium]